LLIMGAITSEGKMVVSAPQSLYRIFLFRRFHLFSSLSDFRL